MRKLHTAADAPAAPPRFDVSTWTDQARRLARNEAEAASLRLVLVLIVIGLLGGAVVVFFDLRPPRDPAQIGVAIAAAMILVALVWLYSYSTALGRNTYEVRRATWQEELRTGQDLDNDGHLGQPPPVGHVVTINGPKPARVTLPDLDSQRRAAAPLIHFPVPPNDVVYVLSRAAGDGLGFRQWHGHRLPTSGVEIDRDTWAAILDGLITWQMASASTDAAGRRRTELRSDVSVETMIQAIKTAVQP
jgi:hypothetical protein